MRRDKVESIDTIKQTKMDVFVGFKLEISDHISSWVREMGDGDLDNRMKMTGINLIESPQNEQIFKLCNKLQGKVWPLSNMCHIKLITHLRRGKQKKRGLSILRGSTYSVTACKK